MSDLWPLSSDSSPAGPPAQPRPSGPDSHAIIRIDSLSAICKDRCFSVSCVKHGVYLDVSGQKFGGKQLADMPMNS